MESLPKYIGTRTSVGKSYFGLKPSSVEKLPSFQTHLLIDSKSNFGHTREGVSGRMGIRDGGIEKGTRSVVPTTGLSSSKYRDGNL